MALTSWSRRAVALAAVLLATGCGRAADRVVDDFHALVSMGRSADAVALLTPDAVIVFEGTTYQGRAGVRKWLDEARRRRLGFAIAKAGGKRVGWKVAGDRVSGTRVVQGEGYRAGGAAEPLAMQIDAVVRRGQIARVSYELTPASRAALTTGLTAQAQRVAAVFDGPPASYNVGLFAPNAVLEVGSTRLSGSVAIAGWMLGKRPASTPGKLEVEGRVVRWQGTFSTQEQRESGVPPQAARFEVELEGTTAASARIRRYAVILAPAAAPPAPAASQPAPAPSQPAPAASQPAPSSRPAPGSPLAPR